MHRYLVRLENSKKANPKGTLPLMIEFRKRSDKYGTVVKNMRITEKAIEFDLYATDSSSKDKTIQDLLGEYGRLLVERDLTAELENEKSGPAPVADKEAVVKRSVELFNEQRYWECHETMEQIWRREKDPDEKALQQGVILSASALVHAQKNEDAICFGMIPRALAKLDQWKKGERYYSLNVKRLRDSMAEILRTKKIAYPRI